MRIPPVVEKAFLVVLFVAAIAVRTRGSNYEQYPYFKGESATLYRNVALVADEGVLPETDDRLVSPEGYSPSRARPAGVAYFGGFSQRALQLISDRSVRVHLAWLVIACSSLIVFTMRYLTRVLWRCQAAGLLAAFLAAFSGPLIAVTNGREFKHEPFALVLLSLHIACTLSWWRTGKPRHVVLGTLAALALLTSWEAAAAYVAIFGVAVFVVLEERLARPLLFSHGVLLAVASVSVPYLRANHAIVAWPMVLITVTAVVSHLRSSLPARVPLLGYVATGALGLVVFLNPFQAKEGEAVSLALSAAQRLLHLGGRPSNPMELSELVRCVWNHDHAPPTTASLLAFGLPVLALLPFAALSIRAMTREERRPWRIAAAMAAVGAVMYLIDRNALLFAVVGVYPLVSVVGFGFARHARLRAVPLVVAGFLVVAQTIWPFGGLNVTYYLARASQSSLPDGFSWVSLGNPDKELLRYVVTRTSTRDIVLTPSNLASFIAGFTGRRSVLASGVTTRFVTEREVDIVQRFYEDERSLYELCDSLGVSYVVYSIDFLLDTSRYSPRYTAGRTAVPEYAVAREMHFFPEGLHHFNLVYENDNYRLFRVTPKQEPMFLTDHPPVYQLSILDTHQDTLESFYARIVDILTTYHTAVVAQARGDDSAAIGRLRYCLEQAPRFTRAWLGVGDSLVRLRNWSNANAAYERVLGYAPDNAHALYYAALTYSYMGDVDRALERLEVLAAVGGDRELLSLGQQLREALESRVPIDPDAAPAR